MLLRKGRALQRLFFFGFGADFHAEDVDLVVFASSHHLALRMVASAACFEVFFAEDEILLFAAQLNSCYIHIAHSNVTILCCWIIL